MGALNSLKFNWGSCHGSQVATRTQRSSMRAMGLAQSNVADRPPLRVLFVTEDDPLYVIRFFDVFIAEYPRDEIQICGITIDRAFHEPLWKTLRRLQQFYGGWGVARLGLRFLRAKLSGHSIASLASAEGVPQLETVSVNAQDYINRVTALSPDVIVSVAAPEVFKAKLLNVPRLGCINIHSGRLPRYRGMMPTFWQMRNGEAAVTVTVHRMVEKLDAGEILGMRSFPIQKNDTLDRTVKKTKDGGARLIIKVLRELRKDQVQPLPLDLSAGAYYSFPRRADVRAFLERGHRLL
jgi:methionyl-tRNA formyltransferase